LKVDNGVVKLGIIAPAAVKIYRNEVYRTVAQQNIIAVVKDAKDVENLKEVFRHVDKDR